jgi:hypothetical protein
MTLQTREWLYLGSIGATILGLRSLRRIFWAFTLLALPGTLAHEALHFLTGLLLNGGPVRFSLFPRREGKGWVMGSVTFDHLTWYNAFFIAMAPLLLLPAAYGLVLWRLQGPLVPTWPEGLGVYVIANLVHASLPSWQDVKIGARSPIGWILLAGCLAWAWHAWQTGQAPAARGVTSARPPS